MKCPYCNSEDSKVVDSRDVNDGVRRRRQCLNCNSRFTTYERILPCSLFVIKKDRRREEFNKEKLLSGIKKACGKRPLAIGAVEKLADDIEAEIYHMGKSEIASSKIGDLVMEGLRELDYIAYIRFASVYRQFSDITALKEEVDTLVSAGIIKKSEASGQLTLLPDEKSENSIGRQESGRNG